ncbi:MAG: protein TolR [Myxococcota bacterium]
MAIGGSNGGRGRRGPLSEINVTPLVDVMLVLLIIFMITAPMMTAGVDVDLPNTRAPRLDADEEKLLLTIDTDRQVYLGETPVPEGRLEEALRNNRKLQSDQELYVRADENVPYGFVVKVFALVRDAGIEKVGLVTEPLTSE